MRNIFYLFIFSKLFSFDSSISDTFSCKVAVRPVCLIFKNVKGVRSITISAKKVGIEHELVFHFMLPNSISKRYRFRYQECEVLTPTFDEDDPENPISYVQAKPGVFYQMLQLLNNAPEVQITATHNLFSIRSYNKKVLEYKVGKVGSR